MQMSLLPLYLSSLIGNNTETKEIVSNSSFIGKFTRLQIDKYI